MFSMSDGLLYSIWVDVCFSWFTFKIWPIELYVHLSNEMLKLRNKYSLCLLPIPVNYRRNINVEKKMNLRWIFRFLVNACTS